MSNWGVTGKLGGGKTLWAVWMAVQYLRDGKRVAANIDLYPEHFLKNIKDEKDLRLLRIPDSPTRRDLDVIGVGNESSDESQNGLLILDECGNILNSRTYNDAGRKGLIEWFLHARKLGWDCIFIVQNLSLLDKQIRDALVEYKVVVKRLDRLKVPFLSTLGFKISLPQIHFANIFYGTESRSISADKDFFRGRDLYKAYSTRQMLVGEGIGADGEIKAVETLNDGVSTTLSPWHLKGRHMSRAALIKPYAFGGVIFGLFFGAATVLSYGWTAGYKLPDKTVERIEVVRDLKGLVSGDDGSVVAVMGDGRSERSFRISRDADGLAVRLSDGKDHRLEGGKK